MAANQCDIYPILSNGEPSSLYKDLLERLDYNRALTNYIYAAYLQQGVAAQMDSAHYVRNNQNEHSAEDVMKHLNVETLLRNSNDEYSARRSVGAIDNNGKTIVYTDGKLALDKADAFNDSNTGLTASVYKSEGGYQIYVEKRDARTQVNTGIVKEQLKLWDTIKQALLLKNIDLDSLARLNPDIFNPINTPILLDWLNNIYNMQYQHLRYLSTNDLEILLTINGNNTAVQRLITRFGNLTSAAQNLYNYLNNSAQFSSTDVSRLDTASRVLTQLGGLNVPDLITQTDNESTAIKNSESSFLIQDTLDSFEKDLKKPLFEDTDKKISSLYDLAVKSALILKEQLDEAKSQKDAQRVLDLENKLTLIHHQIEGKSYYAGTLEMMQGLMQSLNSIRQTLSTPPTGTRLQRLQALVSVHVKIKEIEETYSDIIEAIANLDELAINENISNSDKRSLQQVAISARDALRTIVNIADSSKKDLAADVITEYLGDSVINGVSVQILINSKMKEIGWLDRLLYSATDNSDQLLAAIGTIIRKEQQERDKELQKISDRIQRATYKLEGAGITNTDWMYEPDGHIISDIDWEAYEEAKEIAKNEFIRLGYHGFSLEQEMLNWEEQNTEDRVVDTVNNRTERVPNGNYRKSMPPLSLAQQEYYNTMMQIKGELGTMLPTYARDHYTPPQIRKKFFESMGEIDRNYKKGKVKRVLKVIFERFKDMFFFREDEEFVDSTGYFGETINNAQSTLKGTLKKSIPIFYRNTIKDQSMLSKNFSRAINLMASTAVNFKHMDKIEDTIIFMKDYTKGLGVTEEDSRGNPLINMSKKIGTIVGKRIFKVAESTNNGAFLEGLIDRELYGRTKIKRNVLSKFVLSLINYNSWSALTLNFKGALANDIIGEIQTFIEAMGGEFYGLKDWLEAERDVSNPVGMEERLKDIFQGTKTSLITLINERFNVQNKLFEDLKDKNFYLNAFSRAATSGDNTLLYGIGEYRIHQINLRAILKSEKVLLNGKKVSLEKVFDKTAPVDGVSELIIKPGATRLDGSPITEEYLDSIMNIVKLVNQEHHGAMNTEDRGLIHQYLIGKLLMTFRQWMVKHYKRRFGKAHKDPLTGLIREGFHRTTLNCALVLSCQFAGIRKLAIKTTSSDKVDKLINDYTWSKMTKGRKANVKKSIAEHGLSIILAILYIGLKPAGDDDDDDNSWGNLFLLRMLERLLMEIWGGTPIGVWTEGLKLINKPIPTINTFNKLLYPLTGIGNIGTPIQKGRFKDDDKYLHYLWYEWLPFVKQIDLVINPKEDKTQLWK